jgi:hypothetical protein
MSPWDCQQPNPGWSRTFYSMAARACVRARHYGSLSGNDADFRLEFYMPYLMTARIRASWTSRPLYPK